MEPRRPDRRDSGRLAARLPLAVLVALRRADFRRLLATRLSSQFGDGVFQASLAGAVLFNPERQSGPATIAAAFAVLLLPWSLIGPFAGTVLDRWPRRRTLLLADLARAGAVLAFAAGLAHGLRGAPFYAAALVVLAVSRLFLSGLSAALPHVVDPVELVGANALSTTAGTVATAVGAGAAVGVRLVAGTASSAGYAAIAACSALPYLVSAFAVRPFRTGALGPDAGERQRRETARQVALGLLDAARHLRARPAPRAALLATGAHRLCYGLFVVLSVLLFRSSYTAVGPLRAGLAGLTQLVTLGAVGALLAAVTVPGLSRRLGLVPTAAGSLVASAAVVLGLVVPLWLPLHLLAGLVLGYTAQAVKLCVDTTVQVGVDDEFCGRVFALDDAIVNGATVAAAAITALALPADGRSVPALVAVAAALLLTAALWWRADRRSRPGRPEGPEGAVRIPTGRPTTA